MTRFWKITVAISLVLNLFMLGAAVGVFAVGARLLGERSDFRRGGDNQRMFAAFQALPPERRQALRDIMRSQALGTAEDMRAAQEARRESARLMTAERYDPAAVTAALARAREAEGLARARIDATLAARLAELSPQERAVFSRMLMRGPGGGPRMMMRNPGRRGDMGGGPRGDGDRARPDGPPPAVGAQ